MNPGRQIKLKVSVFEDVASSEMVEDFELGRAWATDEMVDWWARVMAQLEKTGPFTQPHINEEMIHSDSRSEVTIEFMLCSRETMEAITGSDSTLGCHLVTTMDGDPFDEETNLSNAYRVLMVSDREEFLVRMADLTDDYVIPGRCDVAFLSSWLNTAFHEIAHAVLFAENAGFMTPNEVESLSDAGEIHNDVFDCSTGYGIRALDIGGKMIWSDDAESANDDMEVYVEALGARMLDEVLVEDLNPVSFLDAAEVAEDFYRTVRGERPGTVNEAGPEF